MNAPLKPNASYVGPTLLLLAGLLLGSVGLRAWATRVVCFVRGNTAYGAGAYGNAEVWYRKAGRAEGAPGIGQYNLGNALYQQGRYSEAAYYYNQAERMAPPGLQAQALANLGKTYYQAGQVRASYEAYRKALLMKPGDAPARQDFLFILAQLTAKQQAQVPQKAPEKPAAPNQKKPAESQREKATQKESAAQPAAPTEQQLSGKDMQELFGTITQDESRLRAKLNDSRGPGRKAVSDEKDY